jgi:hypothetical protein
MLRNRATARWAESGRRAYCRNMRLAAQGWYRDPYAIHEDRYFSDGQPTKLVRDDGAESYDDPPPGPCPATELIPADPEGSEVAAGSGLRRADDASDEPPYSSEEARRAAFDVFDAGPMAWAVQGRRRH